MINEYAKKMQAKKTEEQLQLVRDTAQVCLYIMTVALNDEYGFGKERLEKLQNRFNDLFAEYANLLNDGRYYADHKLKQRIEQIMGKREET